MVGWLNKYLDIKEESVIEWTEAFNSEDAMVAWYGLLWWVTRIDVECCIHSRYSKASATSAFYLANKIPIEHRRPFGRQSDTLQLNFPSNMLASQLQISILECSSKFGTIHVPKLCPWSQDITSWFWCSQTWISLAKASSPGSCCKSRNCCLSAIRSLRCESAEASSSWLMQSDANCKGNSWKIVDKNDNIIYNIDTNKNYQLPLGELAASLFTYWQCKLCVQQFPSKYVLLQSDSPGLPTMTAVAGGLSVGLPVRLPARSEISD